MRRLLQAGSPFVVYYYVIFAIILGEKARIQRGLNKGLE